MDLTSFCDKNKKALLDLPAVKFAPFMAAGMLTAYFGGGLLRGIFSAAAAAAVICFAVKRSKALLCAVGALWGAAVMSLYICAYCDPVLAYSGRTVSADITVKEVTEWTGDTEELIAELDLGGRKAKVRLSSSYVLYEGYRAEAVLELSETDNEKLLQNLSEGILLSGEVTELKTVRYGSAGLSGELRALRRILCGKLYENVFGDSGDLAGAMLFGMDERLSPALREKLKICGASHYTAVSGAHFAVFAAVLLGMIPESRRKTRKIISLLFAPAAVMFFGPSPSVIRASVMFLLYSFSSLIYRKADTLNSLCVTIIVICTFSPGTILDAGFAMSVLGVFGTGVVGKAVSEKLCGLLPDKLKKISPVITVFSVSVCAVICTSPVSAAAFKGVSLAGAVVSIILMPLMTIAMTFAVLMALLQISIFSVPVDLSMKAALAVINFFGRFRGMWLTLDFEGAWILAVLCAVLLAFATFGNMKVFMFSVKCIAVLSVFSMTMSLVTCESRSEIRFVGNYSTNAAVLIEKNEAVVFISGNGTGLAAGISRTMREHGAVKIACIAAFDADYGGALAIRELSKLAEIDIVYSNELVRGLLEDLNVRTAPDGSRLSVSGITIASAKPSDKETTADIVLYNGRITKTPESAAVYAVYFSSTEKEMPENWHNARREKDFYIKLKGGVKQVKVID